MGINNLQSYSLSFIDFRQFFTNLMFEIGLDEDNELHKKIIEFSCSDLYTMEIDLDNTNITPSFMYFSWIDDTHAIDITFNSQEGFTEFEKIKLED